MAVMVLCVAKQDLLQKLERFEDTVRRPHDFGTGWRVDLNDVVISDGLSMFISVPDNVRVEVLEIPTVDEGVLVDQEESVDVIPHLYGAEDALVTGVGVGGEEGEV